MPWYNASTNSYEGSGTLGARNYESASSSNSAQQSIGYENIAAFTGTNTGNRYNVGQRYVMNGDVFMAQPDGSFRNERTGQMLAGSSDSPTATFFAVETLTSNGGSGGGAGAVHHLTGTGAAAVAGPGNGGVAGNAAVSGAGVAALQSPSAGPRRSSGALGILSAPAIPANEAAVRAIMVAKGLDYEAAKVTQIWHGGQPLYHDYGTADGGTGEDRWGEWGGGLYGLEVMRRDLWNMADATRGGPLHTQKIEDDLWNARGAVLDGAVSFAGYLDQQKAVIAAEPNFWRDDPATASRGVDGVIRRTGGRF